MVERILYTRKHKETLSLKIARSAQRYANIKFWLEYRVQKKDEWEVNLKKQLGKENLESLEGNKKVGMFSVSIAYHQRFFS